MEKTLETGFLATLVLAIFVGCSKQDEIVKDPIRSPVYDVEIPVNPPWDSIPQPDVPIGH